MSVLYAIFISGCLLALYLLQQSFVYYVKYFTGCIGNVKFPKIPFKDCVKLSNRSKLDTNIISTRSRYHHFNLKEFKPSMPTLKFAENEVSLGTTVNTEEILKFSLIARKWWSANDSFRQLHQINPIRVEFILNQVLQGQDYSSLKSPLKGLKIIDVGCGGGLLSEALWILGADVTGVDASAQNIVIANEHKNHMLSLLPDGLVGSLQYLHCTAESLVEENRQFDVVCALEIIEHVDSPIEFVRTLTSLVKPGGNVFVSTFNQTLLSFMLGIVIAEYVLGMADVGTHEWSKFIPPDTLAAWIKQSDSRCDVTAVSGYIFNPLFDEWLLDTNTEVNYIACARKRSM